MAEGASLLTYAYTQALEVMGDAGANLARQVHQGRLDPKDIPELSRREADKTIRKIRPSIPLDSKNVRMFSRLFMESYNATLEFLRSQIQLF